jgi:hypothetical protein
VKLRLDAPRGERFPLCRHERIAPQGVAWVRLLSEMRVGMGLV